MSIIRKFFQKSWADKCLLLEALFTYVYVKLMLRIIPVKRMIHANRFGTSDEDLLSLERPPLILWKIRCAVTAVSKRLPVKNICLVEALSARRMAARRGYGTRIFFGVKRRGDEGGLLFHAWLKHGRFEITGGYCDEQYKVLDSYF